MQLMENQSYVLKLLGPGHHVRCDILQVLKLVDEHIRQTKKETVATVQSQCHEGVCELLCYVLWQHVSNASDSPNIHVARVTQGAHMRPHVHGRIRDGTKVASGLTEGDTGSLSCIMWAANAGCFVFLTCILLGASTGAAWPPGKKDCVILLAEMLLHLANGTRQVLMSALLFSQQGTQHGVAVEPLLHMCVFLSPQ